MIDIHSHLLPGVDDGSPSVEVSAGVLRRFRDDGVERLVCTPHLNASRASSAPHVDYAARLAELVAAVGDSPALELGFEIMLDLPGVDLTAPYLSLGSSRAVLIEFPRSGVPVAATEELRRLRDSGVVPVLAHPERYRNCTLELVREWRRIGVVMQTDGMMLLGTGDTAQLARDMLAEGLTDCIASDNHGDARSLASVRQWLLELNAPEAAQLLTHENAKRLLDGAWPNPVPPVQFSRGPFGRLRELLRGGR